MGLTDLRELMQKRVVTFDELATRGRVAIDAFNTLYQFLSTIRLPDGMQLTDSKGRVTSHVSGLFYRTLNFLEKGVKPVFVFDGEPPEFKKRTRLEREERKLQAEEELKLAREEGRMEEAASIAQRTARLTHEMVDESKTLLSLLGVPFVQAPSEGEAQCAVLAERKLCYAAASQDYDALLFGAPRLVRNLAIAGRRKLPYRKQFVNVEPEEIVLDENLHALGLTRKKLIWIALLCGTDFNKGVHGIGPKKALKLVKENDSLKKVLSAAKTEADWSDVEDFFLNPPEKSVKESDLEFKPLQRDAAIDFMIERDFARERIENALARAFKNPVGSNQQGLNKWV